MKWGSQELTRVGLPPVEARWLLEWALGVDTLITAPPEAGIRAAEKYRSAIAQRRARVPFQHITGQMHFRYLTLKAGPGVFVVRPETEMIVDLALDALGEGERVVADLCSGSGAIGLALASERSQTNVTLVELDPGAARFLNANVRVTATLLRGSSIRVEIGDATRALVGEEGTFDLIASNPPYVGVADAPTQPEAQVDPEIALYGGGEDGLVTPRGIVNRAFALLKQGGTLLMEHGEGQGPALTDQASSVGFIDSITINDLAGKPRFLKATKA